MVIARNLLYRVLIVPLWNWNYWNPNPAQKYRGVLIVPLWNWNLRSIHLHYTLLCSNRTFMELKSPYCRFLITSEGVLIVPLWNWNSSTSLAAEDYCTVLIVPLWNWNWVLPVPFIISRSSNRTFMELKSSRRHQDSASQDSSNRTFMELKSGTKRSKRIRSEVLIVPLWNWNLDATKVTSLLSCSNRTFMELKWWK